MAHVTLDTVWTPKGTTYHYNGKHVATATFNGGSMYDISFERPISSMEDYNTARCGLEATEYHVLSVVAHCKASGLFN